MPGPTPDGRVPDGLRVAGSASDGSTSQGSAPHGSDGCDRRQQAPSSCQGPHSEAPGASFWVHHLAFQLCLSYETSLPAV